jgi:hypothetical protein
MSNDILSSSFYISKVDLPLGGGQIEKHFTKTLVLHNLGTLGNNQFLFLVF